MKHGTYLKWLLYRFNELNEYLRTWFCLNVAVFKVRWLLPFYSTWHLKCHFSSSKQKNFNSCMLDIVLINKLKECRQYCTKIVICEVNIRSLMMIGCINSLSYISSFYSARKRPVPYYRPTPPSSSSDSDMDDWVYHHYRRSRSHSRHRQRSRSSSILHYHHRSRSIASDKGN